MTSPDSTEATAFWKASGRANMRIRKRGGNTCCRRAKLVIIN